MIEGLSAGYGSSTILNSLDLCINPGERLAVLGPSGIGKRTLLRCIKGLMGFGGRISWRGSPLLKEDSAVAMVYQDLRLFPWLTSADNIELPLKIAGVRWDERRNRMEEQLARVGLPDKGGRYSKELSGGEAQRAALARTLITRPQLLLFFGLGNVSKVAVVVLVLLFQVFIAVRDSVAAISESYFEVLAGFGGRRRHALRYIILPALLPALFTSLRISFATSLSVLFFAETFFTHYGLGCFIMESWMRASRPQPGAEGGLGCTGFQCS